jgi:hypothetical protein
VELRSTCKRCRKQAVTTKEVHKGVFHEGCDSFGYKEPFSK